MEFFGWMVVGRVWREGELRGRSRVLWVIFVIICSLLGFVGDVILKERIQEGLSVFYFHSKYVNYCRWVRPGRSILIIPSFFCCKYIAADLVGRKGRRMQAHTIAASQHRRPINSSTIFPVNWPQSHPYTDPTQIVCHKMTPKPTAKKK